MNNGAWDYSTKERMSAMKRRQCKTCGVKRGEACVRKDGRAYVNYVHAVRVTKVSKTK